MDRTPPAPPAASGAGGPHRGPEIELASLRRTLAALAAGYDALGPRRVGAAADAAHAAMLRIFGEDGMTDGQRREATVLHGRLLALGARADLDAGEFDRAARRAELAVTTAVGAGDHPTAARALATDAGVLLLAGRPLDALARAHRAHARAPRGPAAVGALLAQAQACARLPDAGADAVADRVAAAEAEHARLKPERWGTPGYSLTAYHPADLKAYAAAALLDAGLHAEAVPRLEEAADAVADTDGLGRVYVWLLSARAASGAGDLDAAVDHAAAAVAAAQARPAAWAARIVGELERAHGGAFADLAARTGGWCPHPDPDPGAAPAGGHDDPRTRATP